MIHVERSHYKKVTIPAFVEQPNGSREIRMAAAALNIILLPF